MALNPNTRRVPPVVGQRWAQDGPRYRQWLDETTRNQNGAIQQLGLSTVISEPVYGATVALDLSQGALQKITVTDGNAFTISAPINVTQLADWELIIVNASGGALGAITFDSSIHQSGFSAPASGKRKTARFYVDGTDHYQIGGWSGDV